MTARPALVILAFAAMGAAALVFAGPHAEPSGYAVSAIGAAWAGLAVAWLLRDLRPRDRASIAAGAGGLGFFVAAVAGVGPYPAALSFAASFLPALVIFVAGVGRERQSFELAKLEDAVDDRAARPRVIARATAIRDEAREAARALDPEATSSPAHAGDPRGVYAYAAQVLAYARALDGEHAEAATTLGEVPVRWMPVGMRPFMIGNLAFFHLAAGAVEAAFEALDRLDEEKVAGEHRAVLRAARALALVKKGEPHAALTVVGRSDDESLPPARFAPRYAAVRALALAAEGADRAVIAASLGPEARVELDRLRPAAPPRALAIVDEALRGGVE